MVLWAILHSLLAKLFITFCTFNHIQPHFLQMDYKQIQELIKTINKSNISELAIKDGDFEISIKQGSTAPMMPMMQAQPMQMPQMQYASQPASGPAASPSSADAVAPAPAASGKGQIIKSPMIGTFYRSPSPDKGPFVSVGDEVKAGQVLCIIEAMKLFNEIECEVSGRIIRVLAEDTTPVEYDQPLFEIEPA
jgi:acetyl-CoA carboxylase biotin carboxyl carrier protein